jgi:mannose-6-phosphate isomerase-like protein (cupin superfamily)
MIDKEYPYVNHMNILYGPLQLIDIQSLVDACTDQWYNQTLCQVNDSVVRLGILHGEYHWHRHDKEDEFFFTLDGQLLIDLEGSKTVELNSHQGYVVPKGVVHRTRAPQKTVVLMIETAGIIPTGDAQEQQLEL